MTCYFNPLPDNKMDVYDHTGTLVGGDVPFDKWSGDFPREVLDVLYAAREGSQPSAYNQELLFCVACEQIEEGTPP